MQRLAERGRDTHVEALLSWWKLSGVDVSVQDTPQSWFVAPEPAPSPVAAQSAAAAASAAAVSAPVDADVSPDFSAAATLADLAALVKAAFPRAPFADGDPESGVMLIGAGPAGDDFRTGKPFSGPAGRLLDAMLAAIGLDRGSCYIALAAPRWARPTPPPPEAYAADRALLAAQIRLAAPRALLMLGAGAAESLTGDQTPISRLRGRWLDAGGVPALATFNPGYLLRRPEDKALAWADLRAFKRKVSP